MRSNSDICEIVADRLQSFIESGIRSEKISDRRGEERVTVGWRCRSNRRFYFRFRRCCWLCSFDRYATSPEFRERRGSDISHVRLRDDPFLHQTLEDAVDLGRTDERFPIERADDADGRIDNRCFRTDAAAYRHVECSVRGGFLTHAHLSIGMQKNFAHLPDTLPIVVGGFGESDEGSLVLFCYLPESHAYLLRSGSMSEESFSDEGIDLLARERRFSDVVDDCRVVPLAFQQCPKFAFSFVREGVCEDLAHGSEIRPVVFENPFAHGVMHGERSLALSGRERSNHRNNLLVPLLGRKC